MMFEGIQLGLIGNCWCRIHPVGEHPELCEVPADDECLSRLLRIMVASIHMAILGEKSCQTAHCLQPVLQHHRDGIRTFIFFTMPPHFDSDFPVAV